MNDAETKPLSMTPPETLSDPLPEVLATEAMVSHLLHDFKNQLGGVKLYAAVLKKSIANNTLDAAEGMAICDKIVQQIDELTVRTKEVAHSIKSSDHQL